MSGPDPNPVAVVIAGGGVAGLESALALREILHDRIDLTIVSCSEQFSIRPLEVGVPFGLGKPHQHDVAAMADRLGMRFVPGSLQSVDGAAGEVELASGDRLRFDHLLIAVGATSRPPSPFGVVFERGDPGFEEALGDLQEGLISHVAFVVPRSVSWPLPAYELALMTVAWGAAARGEGVRVTLVTHEPSPLAMFGPAASAGVADRLRGGEIGFAGGHDPELVSDTVVRTGSRQLVADRVVVLPELAGPAVGGIPHNRGFARVDPWGRVEETPHVLAIGDAADRPIKQGGLAAQQAVVAANVIAAEILGRCAPPVPQPVLRGLLRTVDGPLYLRAVLGDEQATSCASSEPLWWPPSKLAAPRLTSLVGNMERERVQGIVLPAPDPAARTQSVACPPRVVAE